MTSTIILLLCPLTPPLGINGGKVVWKQILNFFCSCWGLSCSQFDVCMAVVFIKNQREEVSSSVKTKR